MKTELKKLILSALAATIGTVVGGLLLYYIFNLREDQTVLVVIVFLLSYAYYRVL